MIKFTRWRSCLKTPPKKDGDYLVVRFDKDGNLNYASHLDYTVKYGWNTSNYGHEHVIDSNRMRDCLWSEVTKRKGR